MSTVNVITKALYTSPYATLPPGVTTAGVAVQADTSQIPSTITDPIFVIRLRLADDSTVIGTSDSDGAGTSKSNANFQPSFPLSSAASYMVDGIWVNRGTPSAGINWDDAMGSAPISAGSPVIQSAQFDGTNVSARIDLGSSGIGIGSKVTLYSLSGGTHVEIGSSTIQGNIVEFAMSQTGYPPVYSLAVQAAVPVTNGGGQGNFAAPFSYGPLSQLVGIPQVAKTVTNASYDGKNLSLTWDLDTQADCADPDSSLVEILVNDKIVATGSGGVNSASIPIILPDSDQVTVNIRTVADNMVAQPLNSSIIASIPAVTNVALSADQLSVVAAVDVTNGEAYLMDGNKQVAGPQAVSSKAVSFTYNALNAVGLSVVARGKTSVLSGPLSSNAYLLATAPQLISANIVSSSDGTKWDIDLIINRLPDDAANVASYQIEVVEDGGTSVASHTTSSPSYSLSIDKTAIDLTKSHSIVLGATGASGGVSPTASYAITLVPPLLSNAGCSTDQITASWAAPANLPASNTLPVSYQMVIADSSGKPVYTGPFTSSLQGAVSLAELGLEGVTNPQIMVNARIGNTVLVTDNTMGNKSYGTLLMAAPSIGNITVNPTDNKSVLNWDAVSGAATYTINYSSGSPTTGVTGTTHTLTTALTPGQRQSFNVQALGTSNGVNVTGPVSDWVQIPSNAANAVSIRFNGVTVQMSWEAVSEAKLYNISLFDDSNSSASVYSGTSTETNASFTPTGLDTAKTYTAFVQAVSVEGTGLAGASLPLFTEGIFPSAEPSSTAVPYVYPGLNTAMLGTNAANPTKTAITLYFPELGAASGALGTNPITQGPFTIEPSGNTSLPYKLTIAADDEVWKFELDSIRTTLQSDYIAFLKAVESPTGEAGATPYGISLLQSAIGRYMPQTFAELLYYNFGLTTDTSVGSASIDLRPGMVLRASISDYQEVTGTDVNTWVPGYAGAASLDFEIGGYTAGSNWRTGFNAFLSALSAQQALHVDAPYVNTSGTQASGVAGDSDLYYSAFLQPFYRMFVPGTVPPATSTGSTTISSNFALAAASDYTSLQSVGIDPSQNAVAYFRARTVLQAMIYVVLNGVEKLVPIGTTVGNLLDQHGHRPVTASKALQTLRVYRSLAPVITNTDSSQSVASVVEVLFDWNGFVTYADGIGSDSLSMPLLPGDQVTLQ